MKQQSTTQDSGNISLKLEATLHFSKFPLFAGETLKQIVKSLKSVKLNNVILAFEWPTEALQPQKPKSSIVLFLPAVM